MKSLKEILEEEVKKVEVDYTPYFLKTNPFPINPVASPESPFCEDVRREERDKIVNNSIIPAFKRRQGAHYWIHGEWGVGKSAFMYYLSNHINEAFKKKNLAVAIYVDSIGKGMADITRKVIASLGSGFFENIRNLILGKLTLENIDDFVVVKGLEAFMSGINANAKKAKIREQLNTDPSGIIKLLKVGVIDENKLMAYVKKRLIEIHCSKNFVDLFIKLFEDVTSAYYEMSKKLKNEDDLASIFKAIELAGFKMSYLLIDQFENQIIHFREDAESRFVNQLCDLTDRCKSCLTVIMTISPILASNIAKSSTFERLLGHPRIPLNRQVTLTALDLPKTISLVKFYLNTVRLEEAPPAISDLHPFTQSAIKKIHKRGKGLPGRILLDCRELLTKGAKKGYVTIDEKFVK